MTKVLVLLATIFAWLPGDPDVSPDPYHDGVVAEDEQETAPQDSAGGSSNDEGGSASPVEYRYEPTCSAGDGTDTTCSTAYTCPPDQIRFNVWRREPGGEWQLVGTECRGGAPGGAGTAVPVVTPGDVLREVRRLPLPKATLSIQPAGRTLVNLDTVFSTTPPELDRTVTILGQSVHVTAAATRYTWRFGDGASASTTGPGRPYPAMDVTHQYTKADRTHRPRVDVTFTITYSIDGGPTQTLAQTITTDGVAATLSTHEAVPVLIG